jgi:hypothetical protein
MRSEPSNCNILLRTERGSSGSPRTRPEDSGRRTSKLTCYQYQSRDDSSIGGNFVKSTLESGDGTFWVANALSQMNST